MIMDGKEKPSVPQRLVTGRYVMALPSSPGKTSRRQGLAHKLRQLGFDPGTFNLEQLLKSVRHEAQRTKQPLQDVELERLCRTY